MNKYRISMEMGSIFPYVVLKVRRWYGWDIIAREMIWTSSNGEDEFNKIRKIKKELEKEQ